MMKKLIKIVLSISVFVFLCAITSYASTSDIFVTDNVESMFVMFSGCNKLKSLDFSNCVVTYIKNKKES